MTNDSTEPLFLLQDSRSYVGNNVLWWAQDSNGYTTDVQGAHRYTQAEAQCQHDSRRTDVPWPANYVDGKTLLAVDMQYLHPDEALTVPDVACYLQDSQAYQGNDVFWRTAAGGLTTDLRQAHPFSPAGALHQCERQPSDRPWPQAYVDSKARWVADRQALCLDKALASCSIVLQPPPPKPKPTVIRCHCCGAFMSEAQLWAGACRKCGADNRP